MFFGKILKANENWKFDLQNIEPTQGDVLSLTNVCLVPSTGNNGELWIKQDGQEYLITSVSTTKSSQAINIFISILD